MSKNDSKQVRRCRGGAGLRHMCRSCHDSYAASAAERGTVRLLLSGGCRWRIRTGSVSNAAHEKNARAYDEPV